MVESFSDRYNYSAKERLTAIAVKYERNSDYAPQIIEKGKDFIAEEILKIARANDIPIFHNPDIVRMLDQCDIEEYVPVEAYFFMAEIMSQLYNYKKNGNR